MREAGRAAACSGPNASGPGKHGAELWLQRQYKLGVLVKDGLSSVKQDGNHLGHVRRVGKEAADSLAHAHEQELKV